LEELEKSKGDYDCNGLEKLLKLYTTNTTTNMHLFDANDSLQKYNKVTDIIDSYYETRLKMYGTRKSYMIDALEKELVLLSNKAKYIKENLDGTIDLRKKKKDEVINLLKTKGYNNIDNDDEFKYLVKMPMDSVTEENVDKLLKDKGNKEFELETIKNTTINKMWITELDNLREQYIDYKTERTRLVSGEDVKKKKVVSKGTIKKTVNKSGSSSLLIEE
jgi:DNA topoisomerase-2